MQKHNTLFFGFNSISDYLTSLFCVKHIFINFWFAFTATLTTFISGYIWDSASAVYFMMFLIAVDAVTGIIKAIKQKTFSSARLPRIAVILVSYCVLLAIAWNAATYSIWFKFLPSLTYGALIGTLIISIFENFTIIGIIDRKLFNAIKENSQSIVIIIKNLTIGSSGSKNKADKKK